MEIPENLFRLLYFSLGQEYNVVNHSYEFYLIFRTGKILYRLIINEEAFDKLYSKAEQNDSHFMLQHNVYTIFTSKVLYADGYAACPIEIARVEEQLDFD